MALSALNYCLTTYSDRIVLPQKTLLCASCLLLLLLNSALMFAQAPPSDPRAVTLANQAIAAITGGVAVSDVTLSGNVIWTTGSDTESGTGTLMALGAGESRMDLALPSGTRTEIRDASNGYPQGKWVSPSGASGPYAFHNCFTDPVWFFPALGSLAAGPNVVLAFIGQETRNHQQVFHLQSYVYQDPQSGIDAFLSTMDFYLDATTLLPVAVGFNAHPDDNQSSNILVEVDFSDYQVVTGVAVPLHIQKYVQGALSIDFVASAAAINSGLPMSQFQIN